MVPYGFVYLLHLLLSPSMNSPSQISPFGKNIVPCPSNNPSLKLPTYFSSSDKITPNPFGASFLTSPKYVMFSLISSLLHPSTAKLNPENLSNRSTNSGCSSASLGLRVQVYIICLR